MIAPDLVDVEIETITPGGDGLARAGGQTLVVPFTIPGERVRVQAPRTSRPDAVAFLVEVLRASPHRVAPRCAHFGPDAEPGVGPCGGCSWQHIAYPEQLRLKTDLVDRLVRAVVPAAPRTLAMLPSTPVEQPWGYRHKAHFAFEVVGHRRSATLLMGHYVRGSRRVLPVRECPVHDPRGNELAFAFRESFAGGASSVLEGLAIRVGANTPEIVATLIVTDDRDKGLRTASRRVLEAPGAPTAFHVNLHPREDALIFGPDTRRVTGPERMREQVAGASFLVSPTAFFQTNVAAAEILVRLVMEGVAGTGGDGGGGGGGGGGDNGLTRSNGATESSSSKRTLRSSVAPCDPVPSVTSVVLDLYAGAGLFALPLARAGCRVVAIEENREAVADGEASRRLNRIPEEQCRFIAQRVETFVTGRLAPLIDVVILDPPREGCSPAVLDEVFGQIAPARAIYVSCNPEALARELATITSHGYAIQSLQPVDMFPHTAHVETVVVLNRTSPRSHRAAPRAPAPPREAQPPERRRGARDEARSGAGPDRSAAGRPRRNRR